MASCTICVEDYNKSNHKKVICDYCSFESCQECCKRYILDKEESCCMNPSCNKKWTRKFIVENLTQAWTNNVWKKMQEKVCFDKEKALLPETMQTIEKRKKKCNLELEIEEIEKEKELHEKKRQKILLELEAERRVITRKIRNKRREIEELQINKKEKSNYNARVCSKEDCRGYLNNEWKCGLCDTLTCSECNINIGTDKEGHICKKEDVETFNLLKKDTKACPNCNTSIFKIDGCDQMWCTQCHTAFSWRTGRVETSVHNPHYYEYYRNNGGVPPIEQIECGRGIEGVAGASLLNSLQRVYYICKDEIFKNTIEDVRRILCNMPIELVQKCLVDIYKVSVYYTRNYSDEQLRYTLSKRIAMKGSIYENEEFLQLKWWNNNEQCNFDKEKMSNLMTKGITEIQIYKPIKENMTILSKVFQRVVHLEQHELRRYDYTIDNEEMRIEYLLNNISEDEFKKYIQREDKKANKLRDIHNICQLFIRTYIDLIYKLESDIRDTTSYGYFGRKVNEFNESVYQIKLYCDGLLYENKVAYSNVQRIFDLENRGDVVHCIGQPYNRGSYMNLYPGKTQTKLDIINY